MSWYKKATIEEFNAPPQTTSEAKRRYFEGNEMVRYHVLYDLARMGEWDVVELAMKRDKSSLVRSMAKSLLEK